MDVEHFFLSHFAPLDNFCTDCTWWPVYPRTCENKLVDCIAAYTNDNIACGTDWYMYEAMVAEGNDARMLSFSNTASITGGHRDPQNKFSWIVGCLGIVDSCSSACEQSFLDCITSNGVDEYARCEGELETGNVANCVVGCAPTLEMLKTSETPLINLSEGKFGTQSGLTVATDPQRPNCANPFGSFDEVGYDNRCRPADGLGPAQGQIESCSSTPTSPVALTTAPVASPTSSCEIKSQIENIESTVENMESKVNTMESKVNNIESTVSAILNILQTSDTAAPVPAPSCEDRKGKWALVDGGTSRNWCNWAANGADPLNRCRKQDLYTDCPVTCDSCP